MRKRPAIVIGALTLGAVLFSATLAAPARADIDYAWCAEYSGNDGPMGTNCGFSTLAQCRATISGIGGDCYENPFYNRRRRSRRRSNRADANYARRYARRCLSRGANKRHRRLRLRVQFEPIARGALGPADLGILHLLGDFRRIAALRYGRAWPRY